MFCKYCGYEYQNDVRFCPKCGQSLEKEVIVVENVEPLHTEPVQTQEQIVYKPVTPPPINNPVNVNGGATVNTTQNPNGQTVVYVTNEIKKDDGGGCLGCLGWIFIILIVFALLGSCGA